MNKNNKLIGYYQWGQKEQPNRLPFAHEQLQVDLGRRCSSCPAAGSTRVSGTARSATTRTSKARYGVFGYYFPLVANSPDNFFWHDNGALISEGAHQAQQLDRDRKQWTAAATYFLDTGMGSHSIKLGGELLKEQSWEGYTSRRGGTSNIEQVYTNGVSSQVIFGIPTARSVNSLSAHNDLLSRAALNAVGMFVNDSWAVGALDDQPRRAVRPLPRLAAGAGSSSAPRSAPSPCVAQTFSPKTDLYTFSNLFAPRFGYVFDLAGNGKTVVKANYGFFWHNPGVVISQNANPNIASKSVDVHLERSGGVRRLHRGDKRWQPGEQSAQPDGARPSLARSN